MIDYERAKRESPKLKAKLTRAQNKQDAGMRYAAVKQACADAVHAWEQWGAWPDAWSHWQRALDDAFYTLQRNHHDTFDDMPTHCPRLEEL